MCNPATITLFSPTNLSLYFTTKNSERVSIAKTFPISEGCMLIGPKSIHLCAPNLFTPRTYTDAKIPIFMI